MPLFNLQDKNVLFIHVPKTGGTSVEKALSSIAPMSLHSRGNKQYRFRNSGEWPGGLIPLQHLHGQLLETFIHPSMVDYAFLFVRHPVARMVSEYRHSFMLGRAETRLGFSSWLRFCLAVARRSPSFRNNHFRPQVDFCYFEAEVFRFEDGLSAGLQQVSSKVGCGELGVHHERRSEGDKVTVTESDRAVIYRHFAHDYQRFGYSIME